MQYLYHVLSLREPVFIRPAELGGIQQVFFINEDHCRVCRKNNPQPPFWDSRVSHSVKHQGVVVRHIACGRRHRESGCFLVLAVHAFSTPCENRTSQTSYRPYRKTLLEGIGSGSPDSRPWFFPFNCSGVLSSLNPCLCQCECPLTHWGRRRSDCKKSIEQRARSIAAFECGGRIVECQSSEASFFQPNSISDVL